MQDLNDKITGNSLTATEWNELPSEVQNVIEALGIALSSGDLNQLGKAIAGYVANGNFYIDSGAADAYVLTQIGSKQALTEYTNGMEVNFIVGNDNAGASTVNVAGLGVKNISNTSVAKTLPAGLRVKIIYNSSSGEFDIKPFGSQYVSLEQTVTVGGLLTLTHGLADTPSLVQVRLICKIAQDGFVIGDQIILGGSFQTDGTSPNRGITISPFPTNIEIKFGNSSLQVIDIVAGTPVVLIAANWNLVARAWL